MKSFNEFVNEGQQFLRSVSKNDKVKGESFSELREGDIFFIAGRNSNTAQRMWADDFRDVLDTFAVDTLKLTENDFDSDSFTTRTLHDKNHYCTFFVNYEDFVKFASTGGNVKDNLNYFEDESEHAVAYTFDDFRNKVLCNR